MEQIHLTRLAHFVPCSSDLSGEMKSDLVVCSVYRAPCQVVKVDDLPDRIAKELGVQIDEEELKELLKYLQHKNTIIYSNGSVTLTPEVVQSIEQQIESDKRLEQAVLDDWVSHDIIPSYPFLDSYQIDVLRRDLLVFLKTLFVRHGAESLNLLTDSLENINGSLTVKNIIRSIASEDQSLRRIEITEFTKFLSPKSKDRTRFLIKLIDKAFRYLTTVCAPDIMEEFQQHLKDKTIYLDSSVVYRLVKLQGTNRHKVINEVVEICKQFGLVLKVSAKTLEELRRRLRYDSQVLKRYPVPRDLASVGVVYLTNENYVSAYWYEASKLGISVDDFIEYYEHIDIILEEEGITVERELTLIEDGSDKEIAEMESKIRAVEQPGDNYKKGELALEHDAYQLVMVNRTRGIVSKFLESKVWFLTTDHTIIKLQKVDSDLRKCVPLALLPSQLIQILRFITPATPSYDEIFIGMFASALVPTKTIVSTEIAHEILARIGKYKGTPKLAHQILVDSYFVRRYKGCKSDGEKDEIVHETLLQKAKETEQQLVDMSKRFQESEQTKEQLQEVVRIAQSQIDEARKQTAALEEISTIKESENTKLINLTKNAMLVILCLICGLVLKFFFGWTWEKFNPLIERTIELFLFGGIYLLLKAIFGETIANLILSELKSEKNK